MKNFIKIIYFFLFLSFTQSIQVWLPPVEGYSDYAGIYGKAISSLRVSGNLEYRVHTLGGDWLAAVTGDDQNEPSNGYAGIDNVPIDGVAIKDATYKVHILGGGWLPEVSEYNIDDLDYGMAGILGKRIDGIMIKDRTYSVAYIKVTPSQPAGTYSRTGAVAYAKKYALSVNHQCGDNHLSCSPASYFGDEHCGYAGDGGDCANFVSQCLVLGGGHQKLTGSDNCRGYPCGFEEPGANRLGNCLIEKGWNSTCDYLLEPPSYIKTGDVLIYHANDCNNIDAHAVFIIEGGSIPKIASHSNEHLNVPYTYMDNSKPYYQWLHFND